MTGRLNRIFAVSGLLLGFVILLCGCATVPKQANPEEALRSAATDYWKMRVEGRFEDAFKMEEKERLREKKAAVSEAKSESLLDFYRFKAVVAMPVASFKIKDVSIEEGNKASVDVEFTVPMPEGAPPILQMLTDEWVFSNGKWLHVFH